MAALVAAKAPLDDDVVVKTYLKKIQTDALATATAAKAAGNVRLTEYNAIKAMAQASVDRA